MALFGQDRPNFDTRGFAALGSALTGGLDPLGEKAYADQALTNLRGHKARFDADRAREEASMKRLQRIGLEGLPQTLAPLGMQDFTGILQAGQGNAAQLMQALLRGQEFAGRATAQDLAAAGDLAGANAALLPLGAPQDLTKVTGGVAFNPLATPDQGLSLTPLGQAQAAAHDARAAAALAQAGASDARARFTDARTAKLGEAEAPVTAPAAPLGADPPAMFNTPVLAGLPEILPDPPPTVPEGQYTEADAKELMAAAERAIAAGKDRAEVERILAANLKRMGFRLGAP